MDVEHLDVVLGAKLGGLRRGLNSTDTLVAATRRKFAALEGASNRQTRLAPGLQRAFDQSRRQVDGLGNSGLVTGRRLDRMGRGILASSGAARGLGKSLAFASTAFLGGAGLGAAIKFVLGKASSFETELNTLQAVTRASGGVMKQAGDLARKLGADITIPGVSAADAAVSMTELAKGGLDVRQAMAAAKGTLQLATAAQLGFEEASKITVSALNAFGLQGNQAVKIADLLAAAANASQGEISDMAIALQQASAQAHAAGLSAHETVTALTLLAKAGIQGSDSGTSLRVMLQRFIPQGKKAAVLMREMGLEAFDSAGRMLPLRAIIDKYSRVLSTLSPKQRQFVLQTIFGSDATRAANIILGRGVQAYDAAAKATAKTGEAQRIAGARTKGLAGAFEAVRNAMDTLAIVAGEKLLPIFTPLVRRFAEWLGGLAESESFQSRLTAGINRAVAALRGFGSGIGDAVRFVNRLAQAVGGWKTALSFLLSGFLVLKVVQLGQTIRTSLIAAGFGALGVTSAAAAAATVKNLGVIRVAVIGLAATIKAALISTGVGLLIVGIGIVVEKLGLLDRMFDQLGLSAGKAASHVANLRAAIDGLKQTRQDITEASIAVQRAQLLVQRAEQNVRQEWARSGKQSLAYKEAILGLQDAKLQVARAIDQLAAAQKREQALVRQRRAAIAGLDQQMRTLNETYRAQIARLFEHKRPYGQLIATVNDYRTKMLNIAKEAREKNIPSIEVMARKAATLALALKRIPTMKEIQIGAHLNGKLMTPANMRVFGTDLGGALGDGMGRSVVFTFQPYIDTVASQVAELAALVAGLDQYHSSGTGVVTQQAKRGKGTVTPAITSRDTHGESLLSAFTKGGVPRSETGAVDYPDPVGTRVLAPEDGVLTRTSGKPGAGTPGGPGGLSLYFIGKSKTAYFITHLEWVAGPGPYKAGAVIGRIGPHVSGAHAHVEQSRHQNALSTARGSGGGGGGSGAGSIVDEMMNKALGIGGTKGKASPVATAKTSARQKLEDEVDRINDLAANKLLPAALVAQLRGRVEQAEKLIARASGKKAIPQIRAASKEVKAAVDNAVKQIDIVNAFREKVSGTREDVKQKLQELLSEPLQTVSDEAFLIAQREADRISRVLTTTIVTPGRRSVLQRQLDGYRETIERGLKGALRAAERAQNAFERAFAKLGQRAMKAFDRETAAGLAAIDARFGGLTPAEQQLRDLEAEHERVARELARSEAAQELADAIAGGDPAEIARAQQRIADLEFEERRAALQALADLERQARDDQRDRERQAYEEQREEQREQLEQRLEDLKAQLLAGEGDLAGIGELLGVALTDPMVAAILEVQKAWAKFVDDINNARISVGLKPIGGGAAGASKVAAQAGKIGLIPMASGGTLTATGPTGLLVGEGTRNERVRVEPLGLGPGGGETVQLVIPAGAITVELDGKPIAKSVRKELTVIARRLGPGGSSRLFED